MMRVFLLLCIFAYSLGIVFAKEVSIAYNVGNPPLKFQNEKGEPDGILIDIWKLWSKKTGVDVVFKEAPFAQTVEMVKTGKADMHAGLFYTKSRDVFLDYSDFPIVDIEYTIFYHRSIPKINKINELKPYIIGVPAGYTDKFMRENLPDGMLKVYKNFPELYRSANRGDVKTFISPVMNFEYFLNKEKIENEWKHSSGAPVYKRSYLAAVKGGDKELLKILNEGFAKITKRDIVRIYRKWIKKDIFSTLSIK